MENVLFVFVFIFRTLLTTEQMFLAIQKKSVLYRVDTCSALNRYVFCTALLCTFKAHVVFQLETFSWVLPEPIDIHSCPKSRVYFGPGHRVFKVENQDPGLIFPSSILCTARSGQ
jgi:hypothetical protein